MPGGAGVTVVGLKEFKRGVRDADKVVGRQFTTALRKVADTVAREASADAPRKTGKMAAQYRGTAAGAGAAVRNTVFYTRFIEDGFHPGGGSTFVPGLNITERIVERDGARITDELGDAVDKAAVQMGWH